jgi:aminomethyltransferase
MSDALKETPYTPLFAKTCPDAQWMEWAIYKAPGLCASLQEECAAVREATTLLDLSPMNKYKITGPDAATMLDHMLTRSATSMAVDRVTYVVWANKDGKIMDDGTLFRFSANEFILKCGEDQADWFAQMTKGFNVTVSNVSEEIAGLSAQGKTSYQVLKKAGFSEFSELKSFQMKKVTFSGGEVTISRTGFSGDLGYEIWSTPEQAKNVWAALMNCGMKVVPSGLSSLDVLRVESCYIIPVLDFAVGDGANPDFERSSFEMDLPPIMTQLDRADFVGRDALIAEQKNGSKWKFVGVELDDCSPHDSGWLYGATLYNEKGEEIGLITSGHYSPNLKKNIGIGSVSLPNGKDGQKVLVGDDKLPAKIAVRPFFKTDRRTASPV